MSWITDPAQFKVFLPVLIVLWLVLAWARLNVPMRWRLRVRVLLIVTGIPVLGWLTLLWGPGAGTAALVIGAALLLIQPLRRRRAAIRMAASIEEK